ncbi:hypothetical protein JAO32_00705 [Terriglobus sp. ADX1]
MKHTELHLPRGSLFFLAVWSFTGFFPLVRDDLASALLKVLEIQPQASAMANSETRSDARDTDARLHVILGRRRFRQLFRSPPSDWTRAKELQSNGCWQNHGPHCLLNQCRSVLSVLAVADVESLSDIRKLRPD